MKKFLILLFLIFATKICAYSEFFTNDFRNEIIFYNGLYKEYSYKKIEIAPYWLDIFKGKKAFNLTIRF